MKTQRIAVGGAGYLKLFSTLEACRFRKLLIPLSLGIPRQDFVESISLRTWLCDLANKSSLFRYFPSDLTCLNGAINDHVLSDRDAPFMSLNRPVFLAHINSNRII